MTETRPRILLVAGYFDWFSGYQETVLARALVSMAEVEIVAGNRVSPIFSDNHLAKVGHPRTYTPGLTIEHGARVTRLPVHEYRSMVWSSKVSKIVTAGNYDLVIQVMPGQILPVGASLGRSDRRVVLYGDNAAMYAGLSTQAARVKFAVFAATKGLLYRFVNGRAQSIYGYTPDTIERLHWFRAQHNTKLLPLAFDKEQFQFIPSLRAQTRKSLGFLDEEVVIIAAGKVQPQKRLDSLLDGMVTALERHPQLRLLIVGLDDSSASRSLREQVKKNRLEGVVMMKEFVNAAELNALFNASDIGVWPAMPAISIQQAMGTGLTVLIPSNAFTGHLIRDDGSAIPLDERTSPNGLAKGISVAIASYSRSDTERTDSASANRWLDSDRVARQLLEKVI